MWRWGLWALRIVQIPVVKNPKGRSLQRIPRFSSQNPAYGGAAISLEPHLECLQGILVVPLFASILGS